MVTKPPAARGSTTRREEADGVPGGSAGRGDSGSRGTLAADVPPPAPGTTGPEPADGERPTTAPARRTSVWRDRARNTLRVIRSNPTGRIALKVFVGIAGALVVAVGLALIPLPGPGWALVILGLAIWAIEFVWAKHLLRFTRAKVQSWTRWVRRRSLPARMVLGLVGLLFVGAVLLVSLRYSFGIDVIGDVWRYVTTH